MHRPRWQMDWPTPICLGAALQEKKEFNFQELIIILEWKGEWPNEGETIDVYTFCSKGQSLQWQREQQGSSIAAEGARLISPAGNWIKLLPSNLEASQRRRRQPL